MSEVTDLQLSMYADGALSDEEAAAVQAYLSASPEGQARLNALQAEARFLAEALAEDGAAPPLAEIPRFSRPMSLRGFALANIGTGLVIWLVQFLWKTLFGELVINATTWATSIYLPDIYAMTSTFVLHLIEEGTAMFDAYIGFFVASFAAATALWLALSYRRSRSAAGLCLVVATVTVLTVAAPSAQALDVRVQEDEVVTIAEGEVVDDTLLAAAETVRVAGTVNGDLVAMGRRVDVTGQVNGNLIAFAESVTVSGNVQGLVLSAGASVKVQGTVLGDVWAAGEKLDIGADASVGRNVTMAGETLTVGGQVGRDLHAAGETLELEGAVTKDAVVAGETLRLLDGSQVGGDVRFHSDDHDGLLQADTAIVKGEIELLGVPEEIDTGSRYTKIEFYLWQVAYLIGAFLVGLALLWLVPGMRGLTLGSGMDAVKTAAMGFLALIAVPLLAVMIGVTIIGLPISVIAIAVWLLALYLAKILVGAMIGRMLMGEEGNTWQSLLVGLVLVVVADNLPFIGGFVGFLMTLVGLGLLIEFLLDTLRDRRAAA